MAETEVAEHPKRKQVRQAPAVAFLWEQKPGIPKKAWRPFDWEEKPGTPLLFFSQPAVLPNATEKLLALPPPPVCSQGNYSVDYDNDEDSDDDRDERNGSFDFNTYDSFSSAPSLLAHCLVPSLAISSVVPVGRSFSSDITSDELGIPSSPTSEVDSSTSSYATGTSSLVGTSFLQYLFPLLPPKSSFLEKAGYSKKESVVPQEVNSTYFDREGNTTVIIRRPTTLGELIMMNRRTSYQRKAVQLRKQNPSMELEKMVSGCCVFGNSIKMIEGLQRKKRQLIKYQPNSTSQRCSLST